MNLRCCIIVSFYVLICQQLTGITPQAAAIRSKQVLQLLEEGGNAYYLAKFAGIFKLDMQDIGAQQRGMSKDEFKAMLVAAGQ